MKKVDQTRDMTHPAGGNCVAACLASLLDMDINDVPDFNMRDSQEDWRVFYGRWLNSVGYSLTCVYLGAEDDHDTSEDSPGCLVRIGGGPVLLAGPGPRGVGHCVVGEAGLAQYTILHDPHPSRDGLNIIRRVYLVETLGRKA